MPIGIEKIEKEISEDYGLLGLMPKSEILGIPILSSSLV
jgi:hypothetical protein